MKTASIDRARIFGLVMFVLIGAWDVDAMRPHIAAHSWFTLALVCHFLAAHMADYLTVGRLLHRFDPQVFANLELAPFASLAVSTATAAGAMETANERSRENTVESFAVRQALERGWQKLFRPQPPLSLVPRQVTAKLYAFTITTTEAAQAAGASSTVTRTQYSIRPLE